MKWVRSNITDEREMSCLHLGLRHDICITHNAWAKHYWYTYGKDGCTICYGTFDAENWDEAERIAMRKIREDLVWNAELWDKRLKNFDEDVKANETLD
jgi:hypothetical protein